MSMNFIFERFVFMLLIISGLWIRPYEAATEVFF